MIGGISFSATSITSGLDADKPVSPRPGHQYLATDTKKQYNCYVAGTWEDTTPPITVYGDIQMVAGTDETLFSDANVYGLYVQNTNYTTIHQYTVGDINNFFTEVQSFNVSCDFLRDTLGGSTYCIVKVNGVIGASDTIENNSNSWVTVTNNITAELSPGDIIEVGMSYTIGNTTKELKYRNFTIKCATPTFKHNPILTLS